MDALINHCLKPVASTLLLATDDIKKLHAYKINSFLKMDAINAFWSILRGIGIKYMVRQHML